MIKGYNWRELLLHWNIKVELEEVPDIDPSYNPCGSTMERYRSEDGTLSWSDWWDNEVSEEYKERIRKLGEADDANKKKQQTAIVDFLNHHIADDNVFSDLNQFIAALYINSKGWDAFYPVWKAMLEIEDRHTMIVLVEHLLPTMWT